MRLIRAMGLATISLLLLNAAPARGDELTVGAPFPELPLPDIERGTPTGISAYRGRKVCLMIFASW